MEDDCYTICVYVYMSLSVCPSLCMYVRACARALGGGGGNPETIMTDDLSIVTYIWVTVYHHHYNFHHHY